MIRAASADAQRLERRDHQPILERPSDAARGQELVVRVGGRVDLGGEVVDRGRAVRGEDRRARPPCRSSGRRSPWPRPSRSAARPAASTAAVERGVTVSPKPRPKTATANAATGIDVAGRPAGHRHEGSRARRQPGQRHEPERDPADGEARHERADGGRGGEGAEHHLLLGRTAVQDPVDEDGARRRWPWRTRSPSAARRAPPRRTRRWRNSRTSRNGSRRRSPPMTVSAEPDHGDRTEDGDRGRGRHAEDLGPGRAAEQCQRR